MIKTLLTIGVVCMALPAYAATTTITATIHFVDEAQTVQICTVPKNEKEKPVCTVVPEVPKNVQVEVGKDGTIIIR